MRVGIVGLGAIGTHLAAHLASVEGVTVSALVRSGRPSTLRVTASTPSGERSAQIRVNSIAGELGAQDVVFVTLKAHHLQEAAMQIPALLGPESIVVPPSSTIPFWYFEGLSGYGNEKMLDPTGELTRCMPPKQVIGCAFWVGATLLERGSVRQEGAIAGYPLGELDGSRSARVIRLSEFMTRAGLRAPVRSDIRSEIWMKLINSLVWNSLAVLTCSEMSMMKEEPRIVDLARRMMFEAEGVAQAFGATMSVSAATRIATALAAEGHRMSSLQDLDAGRHPEVDELINSFSNMQRLSTVATPVLQDVMTMVKLRARVSRCSLRG